jgi:hypothetical protein
MPDDTLESFLTAPAAASRVGGAGRTEVPHA